jgi:hypothetical protein
MNRFASQSDLACLAVFVCLDKVGFIKGATLVINGDQNFGAI